MKDSWDKFKISSEALKNNWPMIIVAFTALSSMGTNIGQLFSGQDKDIEIQASQKQIAEIASFYVAPKTVTVKSKCDKCMNEVKKLWEFH